MSIGFDAFSNKKTILPFKVKKFLSADNSLQLQFKLKTLKCLQRLYLN